MSKLFVISGSFRFYNSLDICTTHIDNFFQNCLKSVTILHQTIKKYIKANNKKTGLPRAKRPRNDAKPVVSRSVIASECEAIQIFEIISNISLHKKPQTGKVGFRMHTTGGLENV